MVRTLVCKYYTAPPLHTPPQGVPCRCVLARGRMSFASHLAAAGFCILSSPSCAALIACPLPLPSTATHAWPFDFDTRTLIGRLDRASSNVPGLQHGGRTHLGSCATVLHADYSGRSERLPCNPSPHPTQPSGTHRGPIASTPGCRTRLSSPHDMPVSTWPLSPGPTYSFT